MAIRLSHLVAFVVAWTLSLGGPMSALNAAPSGPPVRIGSTLALTGPLGSTTIIYKITGEIYLEQLNRKNGLVGRPVEWVLLDDQSKPDLTRTLYERLVTVDKVDLLIGPYATAAILSAMAVAQRYEKLLITHSFGIPRLATYEMHMPAVSTGFDAEKSFPTLLYDLLATTAKPPKTIAVVTSKFPSVHFISAGARDVAPSRGLNVLLYLEYEFGTRDFTPIATRIKSANPDFLWVGAIGTDGNLLLEAMKKIGYAPPGHFHLFPAPGPMVQTSDTRLALSVTSFEEHPPFTENPVAAEYARFYRERAAKAGLPYQAVDSLAANSLTAWQVLDAAVTATKSLDDKVLAQWLRTHQIDTVIGKVRFDGPNNFGPSNFKVKQVQEERWVVVWPKEWAAPGARVIYPRP